MKYFLHITFLFLVMLTVCSCAAAVRETRFIHHQWPEKECRPPYMDRIYAVRGIPVIPGLPDIQVSSPCVSETYLSVGPLFAIPLPIIPNPVWPINYLIYSNRAAVLYVTAEAPRTTVDWEKITMELFLNGNRLEPIQFEDKSDSGMHRRVYKYNTKKSCKALEGSLFTLHVESTHNAEVTFLYVHRWRIWAEGI